MYYEKLMDIFHKQEDIDTSSINYHHVKLLADFIEIKKNKKYLNPYEFSSRYEVPLKITLALFSIFSNIDGILKVKYFFECSSTNCISERIFLSEAQLRNTDDLESEPITCEECGKEYAIEEVLPFIKLYFVVDFDLLNQNNNFNLMEDPNSAMDCLAELPFNLKFDSLPPYGIHDDNLDGRESSVKLMETVEAVEEVLPAFKSRISNTFRELASYSHE